MSDKIIHAIYDDEVVLLNAVKQILDNNIDIKEVYSPFPIHGLDKVLGLKETRMAITGFIYGCVGLLFGGLLIYYTSNGGIFYKQIRVGLNGVRFKVYKFRTMYADSELLTGPIWADKNDARITNVGKLLRKYHLDEIPQLFNVFRGQMAIVGPRPERPEIIDNLIKDLPYYTHRMKVKPGITGWAQIRGTYDRSLEDVHVKIKHDFYYIENMSLFLDVKIIFLTILIVIKGKGQ